MKLIMDTLLLFSFLCGPGWVRGNLCGCRMVAFDVRLVLRNETTNKHEWTQI